MSTVCIVLQLSVSVMWPDEFRFIQNLRKSTQIIMEAGKACWWENPFCLWSRCTPAPTSLKAKLWGSRYWLHSLRVRHFAEMQTFGSLRKNKNSGSSSRIFLLVSSPSGSQEPQKLKHENVQKSSLISPPLSAGIRELSDTHTHTKGYFELLRHGRMCGPKGGFTELTCMKWQDRQREQITIAALCSLPAFPN